MLGRPRNHRGILAPALLIVITLALIVFAFSCPATEYIGT